MAFQLITDTLFLFQTRLDFLISIIYLISAYMSVPLLIVISQLIDWCHSSCTYCL